jgi:hypothetical protein
VSFEMTHNGLQAWEEADASKLRSIGKINYFRENLLKARQIKAFSYACCYKTFSTY